MTTRIAPAPGQQAPPAQNDVRTGRACDYCRTLKVRCIMENSSADKCQRCAKSNRACVLTAPQKRKQRKRTDTRVAELEREVRAMQAAISRRNDGTGQEGIKTADQTGHSSGPVPRGQIDDISLSALHKASTEQVSLPLFQPEVDVVDRGLLSLSTATRLFDIYIEDLVPHYPVVIFPEGYHLEDLRRSRPTLFLAVMAAAAGTSDSQLSTLLNTEVLAAYATRAFINSEKSLELVQAMIVTAVWYAPPEGPGKLKFYEYIHMAATMALDLGLGVRPPSLRPRLHSVQTSTSAPSEDATSTPQSPPVETNAADLESMRTFMACYLICSGVSLSMRRPNMLRYNAWVDECTELLETTTSAAESDRCLVAWVKLLKITEEIGTTFSFDDIDNIASLSEYRVQLMLKGFEKAFTVWEKDLPPDVMNDSLAIMYHHSFIYLHEMALHVDHSPEDFRPPYQLDRVRTVRTGRSATTPSYIDAVMRCISSSHSLLEVFLHMDIESLQAIPIFTYIRVSYALFVLLKLYSSARDLDSGLTGCIDKESLNLRFNIDSSVELLNVVVSSGKCKVPSVFLRMLLKIQAWYQVQEGEADSKYNTGRTNPTPTISHTYNDQGPTISSHPDSFDHSANLLTMPNSSGLLSQASIQYSAPESQFTDSSTDTALAEQIPIYIEPQDYLQTMTPPLFGDEMDLDLDFFSLFTGGNSFTGNGDWQQQMG